MLAQLNLSSTYGSPLTVPVWKVIIEHGVKNMTPLTYGEICQILGINNDGLAIRHALGHIQRMCTIFHLPLINYLVVSKKHKRPGEWVSKKVTEQAWRSQVAAAYLFDWSVIHFHDPVKP